MAIPMKEPLLLDADQPDAIQRMGHDPVAMFERMVRDPSVDVDKLDKLMQLQERMLARTAQEQFNIAMSAAQTDMRPVAADADNPQTRSRYASYAALDRALRPLYTKHGFGLSFDTGDGAADQCVRVLCYVTHIAGHARTYHVDMPADGKGAKGGDVMTKTHATGAAMSYGMRYLLKMIFNVAVGEDDTDGNLPRPKPEPTAAPAGYDDWLTDMASAADEGWPKLSAAFGKSKAEYRKYVTGTDKKKWAELRAKAEKVQR